MRKSIKRLTILAIAPFSFSASAFAAPEQVAQPTTVFAPRDSASGIVSPRDSASGQATGIQSPRDPASGQATSRVAPPDSGQQAYKLSDVIVSSNGVVPKSGTTTQGSGYIGGSDDGQSIRRKQPTRRPVRRPRRGGA